jgi:D-alanyl-D-alanine carboxypeptidase
MVMKGIRDNNHAAKLTRAEVREIREKYKDRTWTQGSLARSYGVSVVQIGRIVRGESWGDMLEAAPAPPNMAELLPELMRIQEERERREKETEEKELDPLDLKLKELWGR